MKLVAAVALAVFVLSSCGGDSRPPIIEADPELTDADIREQLTEVFADTPLNESGRECVADAVIETLDRETLIEMSSAASTEALPKAQLDVVTDAVVDCS